MKFLIKRTKKLMSDAGNLRLAEERSLVKVDTNADLTGFI